VKNSPVLSILACLNLSEQEKSRLLAETEVPSQVVVAFFRTGKSADSPSEVRALLDELADFGECIRILPEPVAPQEGEDPVQDYLLLALVPTEAVTAVETLFGRPTIERFSYVGWEERHDLQKFFEQQSSPSSAPEDWQPGNLLDQAKSFILASHSSGQNPSAPEPLPAANLEEHQLVVTRPRGFRAAGVRCGIKTKGPDLGLLVSDHPAHVAAMFTKNRFCSPPVQISRERVAKGNVRAVVMNSGNANAATGERGLKDALRMTELAAQRLGLDPDQVLVCSTGIIGVFLPLNKIEEGIGSATEQLSRGRDDRLIQAIMTTDTVLKSATHRLEIGGKEIWIGGIAKGAGMIHPNMATMHAYLTTDAAIESEALDKALRFAVQRSFNCLSVDADTSTSDSVILFANGAAENPEIGTRSPEFKEFSEALLSVCVDLVRQLARDGEGATHLVRVVCEGAVDRKDAHEVAEKIATSLLVKTALFGRDPNWGRIIMAIGNTRAEYDPYKVRVWIGEHLLFSDGLAGKFDPEAVRQYLSREEIELRVHLGAGVAEPVTMFTCDLSYDYVRINAEYHT
jgi:glutamate N-acetyltransferase/amino-acid N-acetyltransferase